MLRPARGGGGAAPQLWRKLWRKIYLKGLDEGKISLLPPHIFVIYVSPPNGFCLAPPLIRKTKSHTKIPSADRQWRLLPPLTGACWCWARQETSAELLSIPPTPPPPAIPRKHASRLQALLEGGSPCQGSLASPCCNHRRGALLPSAISAHPSNPLLSYHKPPHRLSKKLPTQAAWYARLRTLETLIFVHNGRLQKRPEAK